MCVYVYIYIYIRTHVCVFIYIYIHMYMYTCMYIYIYIYTHVHMCSLPLASRSRHGRHLADGGGRHDRELQGRCLGNKLCVYIYIYIHTYTHTYIHRGIYIYSILCYSILCYISAYIFLKSGTSCEVQHRSNLWIPFGDHALNLEVVIVVVVVVVIMILMMRIIGEVRNSEAPPSTSCRVHQ